MIKRILNSDWFCLSLFMLIFGLISTFCRYEVLWDFTNYHFYNPWAFFNNRYNIDLFPAGINVFFSPFIDMPLYFLIKFFNDYPTFILFVQGLWSGLLSFVTFKLSGLFFDNSNWQGKLKSLLAVAIGVTSWCFFMQIGTCTNEINLAVLIMTAFYLILRALKFSQFMQARNFLLAGFLLGIATGLKLTAGIYCLASGMAIFLCYKNFTPFVKIIGFFILGGVLGFIVSYGYWGWFLWDNYDNPFFPFFNGIFKSSYFKPENFRDLLFLPKDIWGYVFYPLYYVAGKIHLEFKGIIEDYRLALIYVVALGYGVFEIGYWLCHHHFSGKPQKISVFLWVLAFCSYICWLGVFSIVRYFIPTILLISVIFVQIIFHLLPQTNIKLSLYASLIIVILYSFFSTPHYSDYWDKRDAGIIKNLKLIMDIHQSSSEERDLIKEYGAFTRFVEIEDINLPDNTLLITYKMPVSAVLPLLNQQAKVQALPLSGILSHNISDYFSRGYWLERKKEILKNHKGYKAYLITENYNGMETQKLHKIVEAKGNKCRILINNLGSYSLCVPAQDIKKVFRWRYKNATPQK